ncbi:putative membrane-associated kinase regulator 6 [Bienertia sinuspersici]
MALVETSQPLCIESFSYTWLINLKPSLESLSESFRAAMDSSDESFFIEMDPNMPASKRFKKLDKGFNFDPALSEQPTTAVVHADELFCDGLLMPLVHSSSTKEYSGSNRCGYPLSEFQNRYAASGSRKLRCSSLRRSCSPQASPRTSTGSFPGDQRWSCDSESSINEAVLHCKKSIGM